MVNSEFSEFKRRPKDRPFQQQQHSQCILRYNAICAGVMYFLIAVILIVLGAVILQESRDVQVVRERYDNDCTLNESCTITFDIDDDMDEPIYLYYELTNYYQNHRLYVKSRDAHQLFGHDVTSEEISDGCSYILEVDDLDGPQLAEAATRPELKNDDKANPCGLIAASLFYDSFALSQGNTVYRIDSEDIAWPEDDTDIYKQMDDNWQNDQWTDVENPHFKVWMRVGASSTIRKLWGEIKTDLVEGEYQMTINNLIDEDDFGGEKYFVLSTTQNYGGKMDSFAIVILIFGCLSLGFSICLGVLHLTNFRKEKKCLEFLKKAAEEKYAKSMLNK